MIMGAVQSKKRKRERRRKRKVSGTGFSSQFDVPRSASMDAIRTHGILNTTCPQCRGGRERTFSDLLENVKYHSYHKCLQGGHHFDEDLQGASYSRGYESCPSRSTSSCHIPGDLDSLVVYSPASLTSQPSVSSEQHPPQMNYLRPQARRDVSGQDLERSTLSLNRNFGSRIGCPSHIVQSRSSEFAELLNILHRHEERRSALAQRQAESAVSSTSTRSCRPAESLQESRQPIHTQNINLTDRPDISGQVEFNSTDAFRSPLNNIKSTNNLPTDNTISGNVNTTKPTSTTTTSASTTSPKVPKKAITVLEDEESRHARWEKQKLMAEQLRILRQHLLQQEESKEKKPPPELFPIVKDASAGIEEPVDAISSSHNLTSTFTNDLTFPTKATDDPPQTSCNPATQSDSTRQKPPRSKFSKRSNYRYLDNHPVLSKLQNEQNNRLETMEKRMREIRKSAMQEAQRRKFAEIFPARDDRVETEKLMQEAKENLEKIKAEKKKKKEKARWDKDSDPAPERLDAPPTDLKLNQDSRDDDDSGDIIPVHIYPPEEETFPSQIAPSACLKQTMSLQGHVTPIQNPKSQWLKEFLPNNRFNNPLMWLLLPFLMFPLILRFLLVLAKGGNNTKNASAPTNNSVVGHASRSNNSNSNSDVNVNAGNAPDNDGTSSQISAGTSYTPSPVVKKKSRFSFSRKKSR